MLVYSLFLIFKNNVSKDLGGGYHIGLGIFGGGFKLQGSFFIFHLGGVVLPAFLRCRLAALNQPYCGDVVHHPPDHAVYPV